MYTYIRNFKFEEREITQEEIDALCSDKSEGASCNDKEDASVRLMKGCFKV